MGILDRIKKAFDKGGVGIEVDCPDTFRWADGVLPVAVHLENSSEEERLVTSLELSLAEEVRSDRRDESPSDRAQRQRESERSSLTFDHSVPITLAPGEAHTVEIEFPISMRGALDAIGVGEDAPGWLSAASGVLNAAKELTRDEPWYQLRARPHVEGFTAAEVASQRLRNLRTGEFVGRFWTHRFG